MTDEVEGNQPQDSPEESPHPDQIPLLIGGIDKELLKESGRASAVQDLSSRVQEFGDIASAIQTITSDAIVKENARTRRTNRILMLIVGAVFLMSIATTYNSFTNRSSLNDTKSTLNKIDHNQEGIDELVAYLRSLPPPSSGPSKVVIDLETLICKSSDSLDLLAQCNELGLNQPPPR